MSYNTCYAEFKNISAVNKHYAVFNSVAVICSQPVQYWYDCSTYQLRTESIFNEIWICISLP